MTNHIFIFGGPRNGSWYYQYSRCQSDPTLYSGTEEDSLFESFCLQPPEIFMDSADAVEALDKKIIAKGYPQTFGLCDILEHEKIYIRRSLVPQWRSFALAHMVGKWHWKKDDEIPTMVSVSDIDKEKLTRHFIQQMTQLYMFYQQIHGDDNFTTISFEEAMSLECDCPLIPSPNFILTEETQEYLEDLTPFETSFVCSEDDENNKMTLFELEEKTFQ